MNKVHHISVVGPITHVWWKLRHIQRSNETLCIQSVHYVIDLGCCSSRQYVPCFWNVTAVTHMHLFRSIFIEGFAMLTAFSLWYFSHTFGRMYFWYWYIFW